MNPLQRASLFTLTIIFSFILFIFVLLGLYFEVYSIYAAVFLTIVFNFILWFVGPSISDFIYSRIYQAKFYKESEFQTQFPKLHGFISQVSQKYKFKFPKIGVIPDKNPTAFTYGSTRNRARIVITEGINHYLNEDEAEAVIAHELGHIHHNDFIFMTIAVTLTQILYEIYYALVRRRGRSRGKKGNPLVWIGLLSYVFYIISSYLLLYLSRVREYWADYFAARITHSPHSLAQALVKIAYGIVAAEDTSKTKRLLESTRSLGLVDPKNAGFIGGLVYVSADPQTVAEVMTFDLVSPWAWVLELSSTHPLTGKRINSLEKTAEKLGQKKLIDFENVISRLQIEKDRLYKNFTLEVAIYFLPILAPLLGLVVFGLGGALLFLGIGYFIKINFMLREGKTQPSTVLSEMRNPYASPMRGKPVSLDGKIVGRGVPGFIFSEDVMFEDKTGIIYLNYHSILGFLGNILFALTEIKKLLGQAVKAEGWFFRGITQSISLKKIKTEDKTITSHPKAWGIILSLFLIAFGVLLIIAYPQPFPFIFS